MCEYFLIEIFLLLGLAQIKPRAIQQIFLKICRNCDLPAEVTKPIWQ